MTKETVMQWLMNGHIPEICVCGARMKCATSNETWECECSNGHKAKYSKDENRKEYQEFCNKLFEILSKFDKWTFSGGISNVNLDIVRHNYQADLTRGGVIIIVTFTWPYKSEILVKSIWQYNNVLNKEYRCRTFDDIEHCITQINKDVEF